MNPTTEFRFRLINTILTAFLAMGVLFAADGIRRDQEQRRRVYTMHLYDEWRRLLDLSDARQTLEMIRTGQLHSAELVKQKTPYELTVGSDQLSYSDVLRMRQHVVSVLNLFEQVAVAARDHVGDSSMIREYFGDAIGDHYTALQPFISAWKNKMARSAAWDPLTTAVQQWGSQPAGDRGQL